MDRSRRFVRWAMTLSLSWAALLAGAAPAPERAAPSVGEAIYRRGVTGSGQPIEASRSDASPFNGAAAACINCHQRSGLGAREGRNLIPPVAGRYLFHPRDGREADPDLPYVDGERIDREPYTERTLARAIREGLDSEGKPLSYLMPRYALGDTDTTALIDYLKRLDRREVPGVTPTELHFATIITPDADPAKRRGMLDVLEQFFADRNATQRARAPRFAPTGKAAFVKMKFKVYRQWELHVWELSGPESTWREQLERKLAKQPVFAVISGLGGSRWAPVHEFCEAAELPCLFPNVEAPPPDANRDVYSLYFSRGVSLEADLIGQALLQSGSAVKRVRQVYRAGDAGEAGARALEAMLKAHGLGVSSEGVVAGSDAQALNRALSGSAGLDALVLWLRPKDLAALPVAQNLPAAVYLSGLMGGFEGAPLPPAWRRRAHMAYPLDLPDKRRVRVDRAQGWFLLRKIPVVDLQVQADTYLACGLVSETLNHMVDTFVRDYLVERLQDMLEHRVLTGHYPHLALATGQRFASKGGYLVRWADETGHRVEAESDWIVP